MPFVLRVRQVTLEEANAKATELNIMFMETSAKAGHNVKSLFKKIAMSLVGMEKEEAAETQNASELLYSCLKLSYVFNIQYPSDRNRRHGATLNRRSRRFTVPMLMMIYLYMPCCTYRAMVVCHRIFCVSVCSPTRYDFTWCCLQRILVDVISQSNPSGRCTIQQLYLGFSPFLNLGTVPVTPCS